MITCFGSSKLIGAIESLNNKLEMFLYKIVYCECQYLRVFFK